MDGFHSSAILQSAAARVLSGANPIAWRWFLMEILVLNYSDLKGLHIYGH